MPAQLEKSNFKFEMFCTQLLDKLTYLNACAAVLVLIGFLSWYLCSRISPKKIEKGCLLAEYTCFRFETAFFSMVVLLILDYSFLKIFCYRVIFFNKRFYFARFLYAPKSGAEIKFLDLEQIAKARLIRLNLKWWRRALSKLPKRTS